MQSDEIRRRFLDFFKKRGHTILPSASLVPENDPSVLFTTAGMQPLVPYLLGEKHPGGKRLVNIQKCVRTGDIDEVGDNTHNTFFEMMGNWSLGDYWKKESINWSYELLTSKDEGFGLDPQRLYVTCFEGDENAPRDDESANIWREIFKKNNVSGERIYFRPKEKNWWSAGENGPCGPDTEMFYDLTGTLNEGMTLEKYLEEDKKQNIVEIWNNVFMEYLSKDGKVIGKLENKNVDTGAGFERMCAVLQGKDNIYDTDLFEEMIKIISRISSEENIKSKRIVLDHIRTSTFMIADGIIPSSNDRGSILRGLIQRIITNADILKIKDSELLQLLDMVIMKYKDIYYNLEEKKLEIKVCFDNEEKRFRSRFSEDSSKIKKIKGLIIPRLVEGIIKKEVKGVAEDFFLLNNRDGMTLSWLYDETEKVIRNSGVNLEKWDWWNDVMIEYRKLLEKHREVSRVGSEHKFKGGLGGTGEMEVKYHTATHLLHQALRDVLGVTVEQKGSNITAERLRFDFTFPRKMTDEEKKKVENIVNEKISEKLPVQKIIMKKEDAEKTGALHFFGDKYGNEVSVYFIGNTLETAYSKEFCGGPHVENSGVLGKFSIVKEEAVSAGVRRIKAVLK